MSDQHPINPRLAYWLDNETGIYVLHNVEDGIEAPWWPDSMPWGVSHPRESIVAVFPSERAASQYCLFIINEELNGKKGGA